MPRFTRENAAHFGRRGGQTTYQRYGSEHMRRIGLKGFYTTAVRHFNGSPRAFVNYFIALGLAATDPFPQNGAFTHDRRKLYNRAISGTLDYVHTWWKAPDAPADLKELPF